MVLALGKEFGGKAAGIATADMGPLAMGPLTRPPLSMEARAPLWDAFAENAGAVTVAPRAADAGPQGVLDAVAGFFTDRKVTAAGTPQQGQDALPTNAQMAARIGDIKVEKLRPISAPAADKVSTTVVGDKRANDHALNSTDSKLGALGGIARDLNKMAAAEQAVQGKGPATEQSGASIDMAKPGMIGGLARGAVTGGLVGAGVTAAFGPVAGAVVGGAMMAADVGRAASFVSGLGGLSAGNGAGSFAGVTASSGRYEKMTKAEARDAARISEGRAPVAHSFEMAAQKTAMPAPKPAIGMEDVNIARDSLDGMSGMKAGLSPELAAMRARVTAIGQELGQQNQTARDLKTVFDDRKVNGVELGAESLRGALDRGMDVTNAAGKLALNDMRL